MRFDSSHTHLEVEIDDGDTMHGQYCNDGSGREGLYKIDVDYEFYEGLNIKD